MNIEEKTGELLRSQGLTLSTAESCTGGGVAALVTSVPGSSEYFKGGIVAYANEVKESLLGVSPHTLEKHGAVSQETVVEMVQGVMKSMKTDCAIATSGIAGPGGGSPEKPVGTIWMAVACKGEITTLKEEGDLGRAQNVQRTIRDALGLLCKELEKAKDTKNSLPTSASQQTYLRETRHHPHEKSNRQDV